MKVRRTNEKKSRLPSDTRGWRNLLTAAIAKAEETGDRRTEGMRRALASGTEEKYLRSMSIVCEADLAREFPTGK